MRLPLPNEEDVAKFAELYKKKTGIDLSPADALEAATRFLQLYYLKSGHALADAEAQDKLAEKLKRRRRSAKRKYMKKHALPLELHRLEER